MMSEGQYRSVADPDAQAYRAAMIHEAAIRAAKEAKLEQSASDAQKRADTAGLSGKVLNAGELAVTGAKAISKDPELSAVIGMRRFAGPVGKLLSGLEQHQAFQADRARGMPLDEAILKHGGGLAGDIAGSWTGDALTGAAVGELAGPEFVPFGAVIGAMAGGPAGKKVGETLGPAEARLKGWANDVGSHLTDWRYYAGKARPF